MATLQDIETLGYTVGIAFENNDCTCYRVEGFGLSTMVRDDDQEAIDSIADPEAHAERELQLSETAEETRERLEAEA